MLPRGILLDLDATAKALAADRAVAIAAALGCGVLVSLDGDIAVAGQSRASERRIAVGEDQSTTRRRWRRGGR